MYIFYHKTAFLSAIDIKLVKTPVFWINFLEKTKYNSNEVCYIGDDLADIPVLNECGFSACPKNAIDKVKEVSCYITKSPGGKGAVRELCDILLKYGYHNL